MWLAPHPDWWNWTFGGGLALIFLWLISVPAAGEHGGRESAMKWKGVGKIGGARSHRGIVIDATVPCAMKWLNMTERRQPSGEAAN